MNRSCYSDDCDDTLRYGRWRAQVLSATRGKRGQAFFRELADALDAMPEKRLIRDELVKDGEYCTLGVLGARRGIDLQSLDPHAPEQLGEAFGVARQLIQEIEYENDEHCGYATPEERWQRMRAWVARQIKGDSVKENQRG